MWEICQNGKFHRFKDRKSMQIAPSKNDVDIQIDLEHHQVCSWNKTKRIAGSTGIISTKLRQRREKLSRKSKFGQNRRITHDIEIIRVIAKLGEKRLIQNSKQFFPAFSDSWGRKPVHGMWDGLQ